MGCRWKDHLGLGDEDSIWPVSGNIKGVWPGWVSLMILVRDLVFDMAFQEMMRS